MLHKSFKPAKCKTSLKLAASRIKLLKNRKEVQVRHLKGELAKLLETGQIQTARIRVEHLVREEKSKEAYELIEIFCELIVARLAMIESQKTCPIDLKEAVSSVIFASPRCADIPELIDVSKHFKAKYGKEFVSAAVELRPNCGVNRMMVDKLSAKAPDGPTKVKILSAIAEEHNIKWDPKSFSDNGSNPPADLLNGPNTFEKATKIQMEPIGVHHSFDHNNKRSPSVQAPSVSDERHHIPENITQQNLGSRLPSQKSDSTEAAHRNVVTGHHISEQRSSEINAEGMRFRHSNSGDLNNYSPGRQPWNMDFKDATAAAQAAAESAERASFAARAAAELSSRGSISRQCSSGLQKSSSHNSRAEGSPEYSSSILQDQHLKAQVASGSHRNFMMDDNNIHNDTKSSVRDDGDSSYCEPSSKKSSAGNIDAYTYVSNFDTADTYSLKNSSEPRIENLEKQPRNSDIDYVSDQPRGKHFEKVSSSGEVRIENDSNRCMDENPFALDKTNGHGNTVETRFNDDASVVFDDYGPDDDFELEDRYQRKESILELSSPRGEASINLSAATDPWIPKQDEHEFSEKFISHSKIPDEPTPFAGNRKSFEDHFHTDDLMPATYDHSDGPGSESEEDSRKSEIIGKKNSGELSRKQNLFSEKPELTHNNSHRLAGSLSESDHEVKEIGSPPSSPDTIQDTSILEETTSEGSTGLSFGNLKGGLRNQKGSRLPNANNSLGSDLPSRQARENDASMTMTEQSSFSSFTGNRNVEENVNEEKGPRAKNNIFNPYLDDSSAKFLDSTDEVRGERSKKSASRLTVKYGLFDDDDDSDGDSSRQNANNSPRRVIGLSRRTKASPKSPISYPTTFDDGSERQASRSHYASTSPLKVKTRTNYSDHLANPEQPQSSRTFKQTPETNRYVSEERAKPSTKEQSSSSPPKLDARGRSENSKFSFPKDKITVPLKNRAQMNNSNYSENSEQPQSNKTYKPIPEPKRSFHEERTTSSTKEAPPNPSPKSETQGNSDSSGKEKTSAGAQASHVHPKLPDYDNFAAHFMSLRENRK